MILKMPNAERGIMRRKWEKISVTDGKHIYNLMVDKKEGFINLIRKGGSNLYFVPDNVLHGEIHLSAPQIKIIDVVKQNPGITQTKIAEMLEMARQNINYHVMQLVEIGMIRLEKNGRETYCYVERKQKNKLKQSMSITGGGRLWEI